MCSSNELYEQYLPSQKALRNPEKLVRGCGTYPLPELMPDEMKVLNPFHAGKVKKEQEEKQSNQNKITPILPSHSRGMKM